MAFKSALSFTEQRRTQRVSPLVRTGAIVAGILIVIFSLFPLYWVVRVSLTSDSSTFAESFSLSDLTLENYLTLSDKLPIWKYFGNSMIVTVCSTFLSLVAAVPAAYSFTRFAFRGRNAFSKGVLALYMLPPIVLVIPLLVVYSKVGLNDTLVGLVLANSAVGIPFATWLLMGTFAGIPTELEEAAHVDGCGYVRAMLRVALPLGLPGMVAAGCIVFIFAWNDFLFAFTLTSSDAVKTLQVAMRGFVGGEAGFFWGTIMAATAVTAIPVIALFLTFQRGLVSGLAEGGVKG